MSLGIAMLLGVIQGLTEFLPVSSSGHLAIAQYFINDFSQPGVFFDIVVHLGTLFAVLLYFRNEVMLLLRGLTPGDAGRDGRRLIGLLTIATIPAIIAGLSIGDRIRQSFESLSAIGFALCVTGGLLLLTPRFVSGIKRLSELSKPDALVVGLFQALALFPGISRSGTTIVGGLVLGVNRYDSARFSFLMSIPAILSATVFNMNDALSLPSGVIFAYLAAFVSAFVVGYVAIHLVVRLLASERFHLFGYYCLLLGGCLLVYVAIGPA